MGASEPNDEESAQLISDRDRTGNLPSSAQQAHHSPGFKPSAPGFADPRNTGPDVPTQARSIAIHMHMCMLGISIFWIWAIFNSFASGNADLGLYCLPSCVTMMSESECVEKRRQRDRGLLCRRLHHGPSTQLGNGEGVGQPCMASPPKHRSAEHHGV